MYVSEYGKDGFFMEQNIEYRQQLVREYKRMVSPLLAYLPWLVQNAGQPGSTAYRGDGYSDQSVSFSFPVYDSTLMSFIKEASKSPLMEKNYSYTYTRNRIRNHDDEIRFGYPALPGMQYHRSAAVFKSLPDMLRQIRELQKEIEKLKNR